MNDVDRIMADRIEREASSPLDDAVRCPYCDEWVPPEACLHCDDDHCRR